VTKIAAPATEAAIRDLPQHHFKITRKSFNPLFLNNNNITSHFWHDNGLTPVLASIGVLTGHAAATRSFRNREQ
jgi:hypothetical protein